MTTRNGDNGTIRVFLVDDHGLVLAGLHEILAPELDIEVVGQAGGERETLERLAETRPDVVVLDHRLQGADGAALCREIAESGLGAQVVMLSAFADREAIAAALRAGARAYISKESGAQALVAAIRGAAQGRSSVDLTLEPTAWPAGELRSRERQLLGLVAQGRTNAEIARQTGLAKETVKSYLRDMYLKMGVRSRAEAAAVALRAKII